MSLNLEFTSESMHNDQMIIIKTLILTKSPTKMLRLVIMLFMEAKHGLRQEMHYSYHHNCKNVQWDLEGRPETKTKPFDWRLRTEISFNNSWRRLRERLPQQNNTTQTWLSGTTATSGTRHEDRMAMGLTWPAQANYSETATLQPSHTTVDFFDLLWTTVIQH